MPPRGIAVAGAVGVAALHHAFGDGPFEEILQVEELLTRLAEAQVGMGGRRERVEGMDPDSHNSHLTVFIQYVACQSPKHFTGMMLLSRAPRV